MLMKKYVPLANLFDPSNNEITTTVIWTFIFGSHLCFR